MTNQFIVSLSACELLQHIHNKQLKVVEVVEAFIEQIQKVQPQLNAISYPLFESAREQAQQADKKLKKLPLFGLPITLKDHVCLQGAISSFGLKGLANNQMPVSSTVADRLQKAGAIVLGMTNMAEFGAAFETNNLIWGRTNNPYDLSRTPGGSSGGEAALIAALASPLGIGTDAGGSIRVPSHYCGLVGLKPSRGRVPHTHIIPPTNGLIGELAYISPMAKTVQDVALAFEVIRGADGFDPRTFDIHLENYQKVNLKDLKVAYYSNAGQNLEVEESTEKAIKNAVACLQTVCASTEEIASDFLLDTYPMWLSFFTGGSGSQAMKFAIENFFNTKEYGEVLQALFTELDKPENIISMADFQFLLMKWTLLGKHFQSIFRKADIIISPVSRTAAPKHGETLGKLKDFAYTFVHNLSGLPSLTVRCGTTPTGLPIGVQITANFYREDICFAVGEFLEKTLQVNTVPKTFLHQ